MTKKRIKAIFFDFDGTLADTIWIWESIDERFLGAHGIKVPADLKSKIEGMSFENTAMYFKEKFLIEKSPEEIVDEWFSLAKKPYEEEVLLMKGAAESLEKLKELGVRIFLQTSNKESLVTPVLRKYEISGFFEKMFFCQHKDRIDTYREMLRETFSSAENSVLVDDAPAALEAAEKAGLTTVDVLIYKSEKEKEKEKKLGFIDYFIDQSLEEILPLM
ncbi:HAD family phosphatase [candidate division WOR-3 bacterium]|nr:HAD family phosphatase [candidate division WOR-3 bacterium]